MTKAKAFNVAKFLPKLLVAGGLIGFLAAFILTVEKFELLKDPNFVPSCNINPVLSCGSIMSTEQAEAFNFPNPFLGIAGFAAVTTIGMAMLAGATFKRWFWLGFYAGTILGVLFIHWLVFQSLYRIGALCPYCMVVWVVTVPIFWYTTLYLLKEGLLKAPKQLKGIAAFAQKHHLDILLVWYVVVFLLILNRFWDYWSTLV